MVYLWQGHPMIPDTSVWGRGSGLYGSPKHLATPRKVARQFSPRPKYCGQQAGQETKQGCHQKFWIYPLFNQNVPIMSNFTQFWANFPFLPLFWLFLTQIKSFYSNFKNTDQLKMVGIPTSVAALRQGATGEDGCQDIRPWAGLDSGRAEVGEST